MALCLSLCNRASRLVSCTYCMPLAVSYEVACWLADMSATCYIVVQVLIAHQATVSAVDHWSLTPLATAVISNQHAVAQLLREHGGALCSKMHRSFYPVHAATITGTPITSWTCPYINIHARTHAGTAPAVLVQLCSVVHSSSSGACSCTFFCHVLVISDQPVRSLQPYSAAAVHELKHHSLRPEYKSQWQILLPCMWCFCSFLVKC